MASFRQLLTAQQSVNTQGIENNLYKINTLLSSTDNQTATISSLQALINKNSSDIDNINSLLSSTDNSTISSLQALINENSSDIDDLGTLTQSHKTQLDSIDDDIIDLHDRLDT